MTTEYRNRYGALTVEPVSELMHVRDIRCADFPDSIKFDLDTAEKIALITENRRSQIAFSTWTRSSLGILIVHATESTARVVRVVCLDYTGEIEPRMAIQCERRDTLN